MLTMLTECPHCRARFQAEPRLAGWQMQCAHCGQSFSVQEHVTPPKVYQAERLDCDDSILSPPVAVPSYKETPVLRTSFPAGGQGSEAQPDIEEDGGWVYVGGERFSHVALRFLSLLHLGLAGLATFIGLFVLVASLTAGSVRVLGPGVLAGAGTLLYALAALSIGYSLGLLRNLVWAGGEAR